MSSSTSNSRPVRRFLLRIALPFLAVVVPSCLFFDGWFTENIIFATECEGASKLNRLFQSEDPNEVACIGNSRMNNGLFADSISPYAYNYGMHGANYPLLEMAVRRELGKQRRTPVIIGIDRDFFTSPSNNSIYAIPLYDQYPEVRDFMAEEEVGRPWYWVPTIRYYGTYEWYTKQYFAAKRSDYSACGCVKGASLCEKDFDRRLLEPFLGQHIVLHQNSLYLKRFYDLLVANPQREVVLVCMPYHPEYSALSSMGWYTEYFLQHVAQLPNVTLLDFEDGRFPEEDFADVTHMNARGARQFSGQLRDSILAHGLRLTP